MNFQRNRDIDAVKGLGIILVVLGHNWLSYGNKGELFNVIFSFHMPLFFFVSGLLLKNKAFQINSLQEKISSLLKPYFVVLGFLGLLKYLYSLINANYHFDIYPYMIGMLWGGGESINWVPMWFLPHLFVATFIALSFIKIQEALEMRLPSKYGVTLIAMLVGAKFLSLFWMPSYSGELALANYRGLPWSLDVVLVSSSIIVFGFLSKNYFMKFTGKGYLAFFGVGLFGFLHLYFDETIDLNMRHYGDPWISTVQAVLGIYLIFEISQIMKKNDVVFALFSYIGSASLFILIFHTFFQGFVFEVLVRVLSEHDNIVAVISLVAGIVGSVIFWEVAKRNSFLKMLLLPAK